MGWTRYFFDPCIGSEQGGKQGGSQIVLRARCPVWLNLGVPRKKKLKKFTATKAVKSMARTALGTPPPVQREESIRRRKKQKHKATLGKLLGESE